MTRFICSFLLLISTVSMADTTGHPNNYENEVLTAAEHIQNADTSSALNQSKALIDKYPTSKISHLLYADMLLAHIQPLKSIGEGLKDAPNDLNNLRSELQKRFNHNSSHRYQDLIPADVLLLSNKQPYIIIADMTEARVYVFRNEQGIPTYETDFFLTIGLKGFGKNVQGDQKTPLGVYHFINYIEGSKLPDLYGSGAFPINYPNNWDRKLNRTGNGIWLHGTPSNTYNRAPQASNGCFVMSNDDMKRIDRYISTDLSTPVLLVKSISWINSDQWQANQFNALQNFSVWQRDWESLDHNKLMTHYSSDYLVDGRNLKQIAGHKKWVNRKKEYVHMEYSNLNIFQYPGESNLRLLQFTQDYKSNNYNSVTEKELYWIKDDDGIWRIVFES
jgi:murein L,D-transpeptidase YafK